MFKIDLLLYVLPFTRTENLYGGIIMYGAEANTTRFLKLFKEKSNLFTIVGREKALSAILLCLINSVCCL